MSSQDLHHDRVDLLLETTIALFGPIPYVLYTDGSGHADGFGGAAALLISQEQGKVNRAVIAMKSTSTERMEFEGLLSGLQMVWDMELEKPKFSARKQPVIHWVSDRESLVLAVLRDDKGEPVYRRKSTPDLWCRFEWYEKHMTIIPQFSKRQTNPYHDMVDVRASEARQLMKEYVLTLEANDQYV